MELEEPENDDTEGMAVHATLNGGLKWILGVASGIVVAGVMAALYFAIAASLKAGEQSAINAAQERELTRNDARFTAVEANIGNIRTDIAKLLTNAENISKAIDESRRAERDRERDQ